MNYKKEKNFGIGQVDYKPFIEQYQNFENCFDDAFIGIPKILTGNKDFYGSLHQAKCEIPDIVLKNNGLKSVLYMEGSNPFSKGDIFRRWIVEAGYVFFSPNSYASKERPTYISPTSKEVYENIHHYRQAEISLFTDRAEEIPFVNQEHIFLMGNSEGALAAARYSGNEFTGRIILSYSCEAGYYSHYHKVGANPDKDPFLNIIGADDTFFGSEATWSNTFNNKGHATDALTEYKNAKVVILPNTGHDISTNQFTQEEIINFIKRF